MQDLPAPVTVEHALEETGINIVVPDGESVTIGPFEPHYSEAFRLAEISTFADLHKLGLIAPEIGEQEARSAVAADDRAYRELTLQSARATSLEHECSCVGHALSSGRLTRGMVQTHLMDLLQTLSSEYVHAKHPSVLHTYHHLRGWLSRPARVLIGINVLEDITIGDRGTLTMTPTVRGLYARDITIGKLGTLRFTSGAVHVRCKTLNGPSRFTNTSTTLEKVGKYVSGLSREKRRIQQ